MCIYDLLNNLRIRGGNLNMGFIYLYKDSGSERIIKYDKPGLCKIKIMILK